MAPKKRKKKMAEPIDFTLINRLTVSITSYRNQLSTCENIEDIEKVCKNILDIENEILQERNKELKSFFTKKESLLQQMASLEASLDSVNKEINTRIGRYRTQVTNRISYLETEVTSRKSEMALPTMEGS